MYLKTWSYIPSELALLQQPQGHNPHQFLPYELTNHRKTQLSVLLKEGKNRGVIPATG